MSVSRLAALLLAVALVAGCDSAPGKRPATGVDLTVMTRSLGRGGDLARLAADGPLQVAAFGLYTAIDASRTRVRAEALADEIVAAAPDVIGLQEVLTVRTQYPSDGAPGGRPNAERVTVDALAALQSALAERGATYRVAAETDLWDEEVPAARPDGPVFDLRLTERVVLLVRDSLVATAVAGAREAGAPLGAGSARRAPAGYARARILSDGAGIEVVSARFDRRPDAARAQAERLVAALDTSLPAVVLGGVAGDDRDALAAVSAAGLADVWAARRPDEPGATCCIGEALDAADASFATRTDAVWLRGVRGLAVARTGTAFPERGPRWPSDRAGVVARIGRIES